jgi:hypothetical protein
VIRIVTTVFSAALLSASSFAGDGGGGGEGQYEFTMPSNNVGCVYTPEGGTAIYSTADGGAELSCDRVAPSYVRVVLGAKGKAKRFTNVGDPSCCGADNYLAYGETWAEGPFSCLSATSGLTCTRGSHGFVINKKGVKAY